jgi:NhaP-type Na+/H+ or K+/H+ antiporter
VAWISKLPAILFLLVVGMIVGPLLGWLRPDELFGDMLFPLVSVSVAVILFEGSLTLKFQEIRGLQRIVRRLVTTGALVTWAVMTLAAAALFDLSWELCALFGAIMVVTGPTVVVPMLRTVRPTATIANILRWEGIVIDPIGALLAVLMFQFVVSEQSANHLGQRLFEFGASLAVGALVGAAIAQVLGETLKRHWLPEYLHNLGALAAVLGGFALANHLHAESGLVAVTAMGLRLANMRGVVLDQILNFKESLSVLLISGLFVVLGARVDLAQLGQIGWSAFFLYLVLQFVARPLKILLASRQTSLTWRERALLAWIAPRGIIAAAVSALFGLQLEQKGVAQAHLLVPLTFSMILATVVVQSTTARMLARALGVAEPEPKGFLIIGANRVARAISQSLIRNGFPVLLVDQDWQNVSAARMAGLPVFYGDPVSERADQRLDLVGIGRMLGLSPLDEQNTLAALRYRREFGAQFVYAVRSGDKKITVNEAASKSSKHRPTALFESRVTFATLDKILAEGGEVRATKLREQFDFEAYRSSIRDDAILLFAIDLKARLHVFTAQSKLKPALGWILLALLPKDIETDQRSNVSKSLSPAQPSA